MWQLLFSAALLVQSPTAALVGRAAPLDDRQLEQLARQYRLQVYETYHLDRQEYNQRRLRSNHVLRKWRQSTKDSAERKALTVWLEQSTRASRPGQTSSSLPLPPFADRPKPKSVLPASSPLPRIDIDADTRIERQAVSNEPPQFDLTPTPVDFDQAASRAPRRAQGPAVLRSITRAMWKAATLGDLDPHSEPQDLY